MAVRFAMVRVLARPSSLYCSNSLVGGRTLSTLHMQQSGEDAELFNYTSGRWIYNEALRMSERKRVFNVIELQRLAAESIGRNAKDIQSFCKLADGGFNRIFLITMRDGRRVIARVPYPLTKPTSLLVASEVATMQYLRLQGLPVPDIYGYSATTENPSGVEYIIMEYISGRVLSDHWYDISNTEREGVLGKLVDLESKLFGLEFPAYGSIYHVRDLPKDCKMVKIESPNLTDRDDFCIGPETSVNLWYGRRIGLQTNRGPYIDPVSVLRAGAEKEIKYLESHGQPLQSFNPVRRETYDYEKQNPNDHIKNLQNYLQIVPCLIPLRKELHRATIRHPDLQLGNILVSEDLKIVGLIDWQHSVVLPLFLQCGIPNTFQNYGDVVSESLRTPRLPPGYDQLSEAEQQSQFELFQRRSIHHTYVEKTKFLNPPHHNAMTTEYSVTRRRIYDHARSPWEGDNTNLKADLMNLQQSWPKMFPDQKDTCPLQYSDAEMAECRHLHAADEESDQQLEDTRNYVGVGPEGWVPNEFYDEAKQAAEKLFEQILEASEPGAEREAVRANWVFRDFDESEYS